MAQLAPYETMTTQKVLAFKVRGSNPQENCGTDVFFSGWYYDSKRSSKKLHVEEGTWYYQWWTPLAIHEWYLTPREVWCPISWVFEPAKSKRGFLKLRGMPDHIGDACKSVRARRHIQLPLVAKGAGRKPPNGQDAVCNKNRGGKGEARKRGRPESGHDEIAAEEYLRKRGRIQNEEECITVEEEDDEKEEEEWDEEEYYEEEEEEEEEAVEEEEYYGEEVEEEEGSGDELEGLQRTLEECKSKLAKYMRSPKGLLRAKAKARPASSAGR